MNTNLAPKLEQFDTPTEWIVEDRRTGKRAFVVATTWQEAAFNGMRHFGIRNIDDIQVEPHEAATSR